MKNLRKKAILDIIESNDIETQNQLIEALGSMGIDSTQATISRDIKELHLVKELTIGGTYRYTTAQSTELLNHSTRLQAIFKECVTSYVHAQNIVVIKTLPGLASAACSAIDGMNIEKLAGSLAGDDTAFLAMQDSESAAKLCMEIEKML